eukprot:1158581-Pelagomonas_calceolata.AAC.6
MDYGRGVQRQQAIRTCTSSAEVGERLRQGCMSNSLKGLALFIGWMPPQHHPMPPYYASMAPSYFSQGKGLASHLQGLVQPLP